MLARDGVVAAELVVDDSIQPGGLTFEPGMPTHLARYRVHSEDASSVLTTVLEDKYTVVAVVMTDSDDVERSPGFEGDWPHFMLKHER